MEDLDYFLYKPGLSRASNKRCKFGSVKRSGATLRRNGQKNSRRSTPTILKHISTSDEWTANDIENNFELDDGGMVDFSSHTKVTSRRGKGVFSPITRRGYYEVMAGRNVTYSMNKKKRWLLPEMLKNEINDDTDGELSPYLQEVDLTVIEREVNFNGSNNCSSTTRFPDTVGVTSSVKSRNKDHSLSKPQKLKRKKYGWSTDMMGLSQKQKKNGDNENPEHSDENLKPQVTYEVCRLRSPGRFPNYTQRRNWKGSQDLHQSKKVNKGSKRELQCLYEETQDTLMSSSQGAANEAQEDCESDVSVIRDISLPAESWLTNSFEKKQPLKFEKHKALRSKTRKSTFCSMKDRVVLESIVQKSVTIQNNKLNISESAVSETYWERIAKSEEEDSMKLDVALNSLLTLENLFKEPLGVETQPQKIHGVDAIRGKSRPVKYAFQMKDQFVSKSANGEVHFAPCYLTLESIGDHQKCLNKENCYFNQKFCVCSEYLPMRLKTIVLSTEKNHQVNMKLWNVELKSILKRNRPDARGTYLGKILRIAANLLETASQRHFDENGEKSEQITTVPEQRPYVRHVMDSASALLGFSSSQVTETAFSTISTGENKEDLPNCNKAIITNKIPMDFCEICYASLSDGNEGYLASSMASCNHWFCTDCWRHHVASIAQHVTAHSIQCPGYECNVMVDDVTLMTLLPGDVISQYRNRKEASAVKRSEEYHYCPRCSNVVKAHLPKHFKEGSKDISLSCTCGARWCAGCKGEPHWPATCKSATLYWEDTQRKARGVRFNLVTSMLGKKCPRCQEPIEKDGGCQMVTCVCGNIFCWKCMKTYYDCAYNCKEKEGDLQTFDLPSISLKFSEAVREAVLFSNFFHSSKMHSSRVKLCHSTVFKWIAFHRPNATVSEIIDMGEKAKKRIEDVLLSCDMLYQIMQYLAISVGVHKSLSSHRRCPTLSRFLTQFKFVTKNIEHCLFAWNPRRSQHEISPDQLAQKHISKAEELVKSLQAFVKRQDML